MAKPMMNLSSDLNLHVKCKQQSGFTFSDCARNEFKNLLRDRRKKAMTSKIVLESTDFFNYSAPIFLLLTTLI